MVAVGYGVNTKINRTVLEEIGGDNVLVMDSELGYGSYVSQVKEMVCGKFRYIFSRILSLLFSFFNILDFLSP